jgi:DNA-binding NtrC family response regulator
MTVPDTKTTPKQVGPASAVHRLVIVHCDQRAQCGRVFLLTEDVRWLGRVPDPGCFVLEDPQVSRQHATLRQGLDGIWRIEDHASRNGTFVNGQRISDAVPLEDQAVIRVGGHVLLFQALDEKARRLLLDPPTGSAQLIGESPRLLAVRKAISVAACTQAPVLILGETGVGKERVAAAIHEESNRDGPLVTINCGALPANLVESELFGHVAGAFTGATPRKGLFAKAQGGVLFLDEIGDMELDLQKKLLRAIATGETRAVGSDTAQLSNARIIAATNVDLQAALAAGKFRADLYARLLAQSIDVAALRARREDVLLLARHFFGSAGLRMDFTADVAEALLVYDWPYNVRELEQIVAAVVPELKARRALELSDLPDRIQARLAGRMVSAAAEAAPADPALLGISRNTVPSREELVQLLQIYAGNMSHVAKFLNRGRRQVYRWAKRYRLDPTRYRRSQAALQESDWSSATRLTLPPPVGKVGAAGSRQADTTAEPRLRVRADVR